MDKDADQAEVDFPLSYSPSLDPSIVRGGEYYGREGVDSNEWSQCFHNRKNKLPTQPYQEYTSKRRVENMSKGKQRHNYPDKRAKSISSHISLLFFSSRFPPPGKTSCHCCLLKTNKETKDKRWYRLLHAAPLGSIFLFFLSFLSIDMQCGMQRQNKKGGEG